MRRVIEVSAALVVASLGISSTTAAAAEESGVYVAASYGQTPKLFPRSDLDAALVGLINDPLTLDSSSVHKHGTTWSAGVGYRMGRGFAVEATYLDLGKVHYHASGSLDVSGTSYATNLEQDMKSHGPALALVWALPLWNAWGVDARTGIYRGTTSTELVNTVGESVKPFSASEKSTSLLLGLGGSYVATEHVIVRLDYLHLKGVKEKAFEKSFPADVVTAGITYEF